MYDTVVAS